MNEMIYDFDNLMPDTEHDNFIIDSPEKADWAIERIKENNQRYDIGIQAAKAKIEYYKAWIAEAEKKKVSDNQFLMARLGEYIDAVPAKVAKTQKSIEFPSGKVILKFASAKMVPDDDKLIASLKGTEYVSYDPKLAWGEYKKRLEIKGDVAVDKTTGEIVDGVTVEISPEVLEVK